MEENLFAGIWDQATERAAKICEEMADASAASRDSMGDADHRWATDLVTGALRRAAARIRGEG